MKTYLRVFDHNTREALLYEMDQLHEFNARLHNECDKGNKKLNLSITFVELPVEEFNKLESAQ